LYTFTNASSTRGISKLVKSFSIPVLFTQRVSSASSGLSQKREGAEEGATDTDGKVLVGSTGPGNVLLTRTPVITAAPQTTTAATLATFARMEKLTPIRAVVTATTAPRRADDAATELAAFLDASIAIS
jgi:hypothetical protein